MNDIELIECGRKLPLKYTYGGKSSKRIVDKSTGDVTWKSKATFRVNDWAIAPALLIAPDKTGYPVFIDKTHSFTLNTPEELLEYILERKCVVTYSPNNEVQSIFKLFDHRTCQQLAFYKGQYVPYKNYWIRITGNKSILIRKGKNYGWLSNFHRLQPDDFEPTISNLEATSQEFFTLLSDSGIELRNPSSPGGIGEAYLLQTAGGSFPYIPNSDIEIEHITRAYNCYKGGRMEALQIGHFDNLYNYDFTNQYASILGELQDCRTEYTNWIESKDYQPSAFYGFVRAKVTIPETWLSPMTFRQGENSTTFPYGTMIAWISKPELDLLYATGCKVEIIEGTWGIPEMDCKPFRYPIGKLYELRNGKFSNAIKLASVASIGKIGAIYENIDIKTGEITDIGSPSFNPIYISHLNSVARVRLYETARVLGDSQQLVSLTIDGILSTKEVSIPKVKESGKLRLVSSGKALVMTDYYKDKPNSPTVYRKMLENAGDEDKVIMAHIGFNGINIFNKEIPVEEAHMQLGKPNIISYPVKFGSAFRHNPRVKAIDLTKNSYPTNSSDVMDLVDFAQNRDYLNQIMLSDEIDLEE